MFAEGLLVEVLTFILLVKQKGALHEKAHKFFFRIVCLVQGTGGNDEEVIVILMMEMKVHEKVQVPWIIFAELYTSLGQKQNK